MVCYARQRSGLEWSREALMGFGKAQLSRGQAPYGMVTEMHCGDQSRNSVDGAAWHCHGMVSNRISLSGCGIEQSRCVA